jgi:diguanylate cyclase (GGDEF)-like protein/PAS domain S-box-containing protein
MNNNNQKFLNRLYTEYQEELLSSTYEKLSGNDLHKSLEALSHILNDLNVGIWTKDLQTNQITYISESASKILQSSSDQIIHSNIWEQLIHAEDRTKVFEKEKLLLDGKVITQKYRINCRSGNIKWIYDQSVPLLNNKKDVIGLFKILTDITSEVEIQQQHKYKATHDLLTGLPNQRSLYKQIDELIYNGQDEEFVLLYLDLDRFTLINDFLGHHIGDLVLKEITTRLLSVSTKDVFITCLNNNDFIIVMKSSPSKEMVTDLANTLVKLVEKVITIEDYELHVTTCIGISHFPNDGQEKVKLIANAHIALNRAKQHGINNIEFHSLSKDINSYKKLALEQDMRKAIENKEFELYFQPIVRPDTGKIESAEALIRWNHSEWGLVSPSEFIPLAEENHLIIQITDWLIREICITLRTWKDNDYPLKPVSINISPICFMKKGFIELVKELLAKHHLNGHNLIFEITENSLLSYDREVLHTIQQLKKIGIRIALDDFGTGFSSLQYLREFPIDTIKIDQIFMQNIHTENIHDSAIVSSLIHLASKLNMKVVAEGVEEEEQLKFLMLHNCDLVQGYLFSKPVPLNIYSQMLNIEYLRPNNNDFSKTAEREERIHSRIKLPNYVIGKMSITKINGDKVKLDKVNILVENIGLDGLMILSSLNLPINSSIKFKFFMEIIGESFEFSGQLIWKEESKGNAFYYGIQFLMNETEQDQLANILNKLTTLLHTKQEILNTPFLYENPYAFLMQKNE